VGLLAREEREASSQVEGFREEKVRENRLRRTARRRGMLFVKSRRRDPRACDYGRYWLVVQGEHYALLTPESGVTLDEVEEYLSDGWV